MKLSIRKELPLIAIVLLPFAYLAYIWNDLPDKVPMHWNLQGEVDRYGDKSELLLIPILLPLLIYVIFLIVPKIDPKKKLKYMGNKYGHIKALLTVCMSLLALYIIYSFSSQSIGYQNYLLMFLGVLYVILGNYFKTIKPNYFIGIKTPWTLENETVWKETHRMAGKIWFAGGLVIVFSGMVFARQTNFVLFLVITGVITVIPVVYSFLKFLQLKRRAEQA